MLKRILIWSFVPAFLNDSQLVRLRNNFHPAKQNRFGIGRLPESSAALCDRPLEPRVDFPVGKRQLATRLLHEAEAVFAKLPAQWSESVCCGDSERAIRFRQSRSSESYVKGTTCGVIRQGRYADEAWTSAGAEAHSSSDCNGTSELVPCYEDSERLRTQQAASLHRT